MFKKEKKQKEYRHPIMRSLHGEKLLVHMEFGENRKYKCWEHWVKLNEPSIKAMGYIPATDYKSEFRDIFTRVYIKLDGLEMYPCVRMDGSTGEEIGIVESKETASTLYDYFRSTAEQDFLDSMKVKAVSSLSSKQMIFYVIIGIGVVIGGYLITMGH